MRLWSVRGQRRVGARWRTRGPRSTTPRKAGACAAPLRPGGHAPCRPPSPPARPPRHRPSGARVMRRAQRRVAGGAGLRRQRGVGPLAPPAHARQDHGPPSDRGDHALDCLCRQAQEHERQGQEHRAGRKRPRDAAPGGGPRLGGRKMVAQFGTARASALGSRARPTRALSRLQRRIERAPLLCTFRPAEHERRAQQPKRQLASGSAPAHRVPERGTEVRVGAHFRGSSCASSASSAARC